MAGGPATGMGWVREQGGSVRVGGRPGGGPAGGAPWSPPTVVRTFQQRTTGSPRVAAPAPRRAATPAAGSTTPSGTWTPPPLPTGSYNPERDIQTEESQRGLGQMEGELGTARSRDTADYFTQKAEIERGAANQKTDFEKAQQQLKQSYQKLGASQEQGANKLGVLQGGALLQSAAKRATNEGQESQTQKTNYQRQQDATSQELAKLAREGAPPEGANPLGGRSFQDLLTKLTNAQANNTFYGESQQRLAGQEAAERGYVPPTAPASHVAAQNASRSAGAAGAPRVVSSRPQPSSGTQSLRRQPAGQALARARQLARERSVGRRTVVG